MRRFGHRAALALAACGALALGACGQNEPSGEAQGESQPTESQIAETKPTETQAETIAEDMRAGGPDAERRAELASNLTALEQKLALVEDSNDIKRLQHAYGYYLSEGMWDEAADLFAEDATIEYALDGVYRGRDRVEAYLTALGGGEDGLGEGVLNEHLQVMPVVTVSPTRNDAEARWRDIILAGTLGQNATWGEGPILADYVRQDGVWRIAALHWYDSVTVPYETGWLETPDPTGGRFVTELEPDAPPSDPYETWPGVRLPDFHFRQGQDGPTSAAITGFAADSLDSLLQRIVAPADAPSMDELAERAALLTRKTGLIEAENQAENLQRAFSYYIDKNMWSDAAALFADDAVFEWGGSGVYRGPDSIQAYLAAGGPEGPQEGVLDDHMILMPTVHVAADGTTAQGRFQGWNQMARHGEWARWQTGVYETDFVNDGGIWKIAAMRFYVTMTTPYEDGWGVTALPLNQPLADPAPDGPQGTDYDAYPAAFTPPFHFANPATDPYAPEIAADPAVIAADLGEVAAQLDSLDRRITALQDIEALENLNSIYGFYLAHNQWDSLADLFAGDGIIEIAMRGQYVGKDAVRRNLNLYGEQGGEQHGLLHNHMQFQPLITLAPDGETAKIRSRALSIMGEFETYANWMGGVYENDFEKTEDGWKIKRDQVFNTYFAAYDQGWKDITRRSPPGITDANPPDLPPSLPFEMYPSAFLPPYHYPHPVTGQTTPAPNAG